MAEPSQEEDYELDGEVLDDLVGKGEGEGEGGREGLCVSKQLPGRQLWRGILIREWCRLPPLPITSGTARR